MTVHSLTVRWAAGERTISPEESPVTIGRDPSCAITLDDSSVSRVHAELRCIDDQWTFVDMSSTQGSHQLGQKVASVAIDAPLTLILGNPRSGESLELVPAVPAVSTAAATSIDSGVPATEIVSPSAARPGGELREEQLVGATVVTGDSLNVSVAGESRTLGPTESVTIGRDPACDIVSGNPTVSRRHARIYHSGSDWRIEDLQSSSGTYLDGKRITSVALAGTMALWLGEPEVGERVVTAAGGERHLSATQRLERASRNRNGTLIGAVAVIALVAAAVAGFAIWRSSSSPDNSALVESTVKIIVDDGSGSGTIIDADRGLILTNAHVVAPQAPGQALEGNEPASKLDPNPSKIEIAVSSGLGQAAEPKFTGKVVAVDGYLDLAVVKITNTISGSVISTDDLGDLKQINIGNSDDVNTGDDVRVVGFPAAAESLEATLTKGVVSGAVKDQRLTSNRGYLNVDADINPGNSGGLAVNDDGDMVGVPTLGRLDKNTVTKIGSMRPINFASDLIKAAQNGTAYKSKYVQPLNGGETISNMAVVAPTQESGFSSGCTAGTTTVDASSTKVAYTFDYDGFTKGAHQDVLVGLVDTDSLDVVGSAATTDQFPYLWGAKGCANVTIPLDSPLVAGHTYAPVVLVGPNYELDESANNANGAFSV